jgi:hypothetical protein
MDHRQNAQDRIRDLMTLVEQTPPSETKTKMIEECEALARATAAFHLEGIRFRSYNVDRLLHKGGLPLPPAAEELFAEIRKALEAAGFHTRSHHAPQ